MGSGTIGHCVDCHAAQAADEATAYSFLQTAGYIKGTQSTVASIFGFMGGTMPPGTTTKNDKATTEVNEWVAAGAKDD
jgi:hypothetical protein